MFNSWIIDDTVVTNAGAAPASFTVTFSATAAVANPGIYHVERQSYIKLNKVMAAGEKLIVSTVYGQRGARLIGADSTESNAFCYLDVGSDLAMQLDPGANTLRVTADANRENLSVTLLAPKGVRQGL